MKCVKKHFLSQNNIWGVNLDCEKSFLIVQKCSKIKIRKGSKIKIQKGSRIKIKKSPNIKIQKGSKGFHNQNPKVF